MPCFHPVRAYQSTDKKPNGKTTIQFKPSSGVENVIELPCGQCIGCRLEISRQWAMRCLYEANQFEINCFITLTYSEENIPKYGNLKKNIFKTS